MANTEATKGKNELEQAARQALVALIAASGYPVAAQRCVADGYAYLYVQDPGHVMTGEYQRRAESLGDLSLEDLAHLASHGVRGKQVAEIRAHCDHA